MQCEGGGRSVTQNNVYNKILSQVLDVVDMFIFCHLNSTSQRPCTNPREGNDISI